MFSQSSLKSILLLFVAQVAAQDVFSPHSIPQTTQPAAGPSTRPAEALEPFSVFEMPVDEPVVTRIEPAHESNFVDQLTTHISNLPRHMLMQLAVPFLEKRREVLKKDIEALQAEVGRFDEKHREFQDLSAAVERIRDEGNTRQSQLEQLKSDLHKQHQAREAGDVLLSQIRDSIVEAKQNLATARQQSRDAELKFREILVAREDAQKVLGHIDEQIHIATSQKEALEGASEKLREEQMKMQSEITQASGRLTQVDSQLQEKQATLAAVMRQVSDGQSQLTLRNNQTYRFSSTRYMSGGSRQSVDSHNTSPMTSLSPPAGIPYLELMEGQLVRLNTGDYVQLTDYHEGDHGAEIVFDGVKLKITDLGEQRVLRSDGAQFSIQLLQNHLPGHRARFVIKRY